MARSVGWPCLVNSFTETWHGRGADEQTLADEYTADDPDIGVVYAGEAAGLVRAQRPAADVIRDMGAQAEELLGRFH